MKKINKARKITENDLRNLHYIHENEGLIPVGVTRLEDEDITSAEVITENKKSKVNESEDDEYTREDYENDLGGYLISLPYEKVKAYKKINAKLTSEEIEELKQKFDKLEHDSVDLDDKLANGEITEEKYYKVRDNLIKKSLKIFRKLTGGCDPDWYDPDEMGDLDPDLKNKVNEEDIEGRIPDSEIHGNPSTEIGSGNVIIFSIEANYILKKDKETIFKDALKAYKRLSGISVDSIDDPVFDGGQLYDFIMEVLQNNEHTSKIIIGVKPLIATYYLKHGYGEPYEVLCTEADYGIKGFRKIVSTFESDTTYDIDYWINTKDQYQAKKDVNTILSMLGYRTDPDQEDTEEIIKHFDTDYNEDEQYIAYIRMLLGYYYMMFGRTEFYKEYASKYGTILNESSIEANNQYWKFIQRFKESVGEDSEIYKELMTQLQSIKDYDVHAAYNLTKEFLTDKGLWDQYSSDFEAIPVNENDMDEFRKLIDSDVWKKFKEDWKGTDVYDAAMDAISYVDTLPQMVNGLKRVFDVYDMLVDYEADLDKLLSTSINEYKTVGVYKPNDGEVDDLYYIQAGDIILIHHKDYGELQCKVKKVDADKNKVYFVTIERGIMGVCGFDKIHGIQLVEECQKRPMFVQTKHIKFPDGGMCYMCYAKIGSRFVDVYCTFGISLDNCECIKLLNMTEDEFGIIDNIMAESDTVDDAKNRVYNSGLVSL